MSLLSMLNGFELRTTGSIDSANRLGEVLVSELAG